MRDVLLNMMRTFFRRKFGELFYRLVVIDLKPHHKGLIVEMGLLLDPNIDNLKDIETSLEDQVRQIREGIKRKKIIIIGKTSNIGRISVRKIRFLC